MRSDIKHIVENGCFICISHKTDKQGYPRNKHGRIINQISNTKTDRTNVIRHTCKNKLCINPKHLEIVGWGSKDIEYHIDDNDCHICSSHILNYGGYPKKGNSSVIKYMFEKKYGKIKKGFVLRHTCDNRRCINLNHIITGTNVENSRDMVIRNRQAKGENHGNSKLKDKDIIKIRRSKKTQKKLGEMFNVSQANISDIKLKNTWKHVLEENKK